MMNTYGWNRAARYCNVDTPKTSWNQHWSQRSGPIGLVPPSKGEPWSYLARLMNSPENCQSMSLTLFRTDKGKELLVPKKKEYTLSTFDGKLFDGLTFCRKVYDFFDQIRAEPDGISKLRVRSRREKKLIEELIPVARYVQERYRLGRRIKVRWFSGSQPFDARSLSSGVLVQHGMAPKKLQIEVTLAVHQNDYLRRKLLNEQGGTFGVKGISKDKNGVIRSEPHVYKGNERIVDLADQILGALRKKSAKNYPRGTVLIVDCVADGLIDDAEWTAAVQEVEKAQVHEAFREVFLFDLVASHSATLYGKKKLRRQVAA